MKKDRISENVEILEKKPLYNRFFQATEYRVSYPLYNGSMSEVCSREVMDRGDAVGVLLYDPITDKLAFVEQFRIGAYLSGENPWMLECVAGMLDKGLTKEEVLYKEAKEEAGVELLEIMPMLSYFSSPGGLTEKIYLYCAKIDSTQLPEYAGLETEHEDIRIVQFNADEVEGLLSSDKANNGLLVITLQWFLLNRTQLKEKWGK